MPSPNLVTTSTGIVIGGAWQPKPPAMSDDAEYLQAVLLSGMPGAVDPGRCPSPRLSLLQRFVRWLDRHTVDPTLLESLE